MDGHEGFFVGLFTAGLVAFTAALWRSTEKLWDAGERQLGFSRRTAAVQAVNTRRQLRHAERVAERQLRAYVLTDSHEPVVSLKIEAGKPPSGFVRIRNYGQTPAYGMHVVISTAIGPGDPPPDQVLESKLLPSHESVMILAPQSDAVFGIPETKDGRVVAPHEADGVKSGELTILIFGRVSYRDAFDSPRWTRFCIQSVPTTDPASRDYAFTRSRSFNDAD